MRFSPYHKMRLEPLFRYIRRNLANNCMMWCVRVDRGSVLEAHIIAIEKFRFDFIIYEKVDSMY